MEHPIGSPRLRELSREQEKHCVNSQRPHASCAEPSALSGPSFEIREGNPDAVVTVLIATGFHRPTTREELAAKFGEEYMDRDDIRFVVHKGYEAGNMVEAGILPSGGLLKVNRIAAEADLLIAEGFIEPHFSPVFPAEERASFQAFAAQKPLWQITAQSLSPAPLREPGTFPRTRSTRTWCMRRKSWDWPLF